MVRRSTGSKMMLNYVAILVAVLAVAALAIPGDKIIDSTPKFLSCLSALPMLTFVATKARRCMYGGVIILGS
jgi:hypothetical protein